MIRDKRPPKNPHGSQDLSTPSGSVALERMYICNGVQHIGCCAHCRAHRVQLGHLRYQEMLTGGYPQTMEGSIGRRSASRHWKLIAAAIVDN
jgi:hypothetical protein